VRQSARQLTDRFHLLRLAKPLLGIPRNRGGLGLNVTVADLTRRNSLIRLDRQFFEPLAFIDSALHQRLHIARTTPDASSVCKESDLIVGRPQP
jgi:hypothetical protein